jgi:nucleoside-diphosphate-sugar epimerase
MERPIVKPTPDIPSPLSNIIIWCCKIAGEAIVSGYCHMFEIHYIVARMANIICPTDCHGVIHDFISKLSNHPDYHDANL